MDKLPSELILKICDDLHDHECYNLSICSKKYLFILKDKRLWSKHLSNNDHINILKLAESSPLDNCEFSYHFYMKCLNTRILYCDYHCTRGELKGMRCNIIHHKGLFCNIHQQIQELTVEIYSRKCIFNYNIVKMGENFYFCRYNNKILNCRDVIPKGEHKKCLCSTGNASDYLHTLDKILFLLNLYGNKVFYRRENINYFIYTEYDLSDLKNYELVRSIYSSNTDDEEDEKEDEGEKDDSGEDDREE